ncbi:S41 family peptidase [bacterium]|nr:S41 family peptidase [bacterium]
MSIQGRSSRIRTAIPSCFITCLIAIHGAALTGSVALASQTAAEIASDARYKSLETLARGLHYLETMYVDESKVKEPALVQGAFKGMVDQLDPHTMHMPAKAYEQLTIDTQGKFGGVGVIVSQEKGKLIVVSPIEDTPAARAGVRSGDEIIEINGHVVTNLKNDDAVDRMRGDPGSKLKLKIRRQNVAEPVTFELVREIIRVKSVRRQSLGPKFEYVRISSFQEGTGDELSAMLKDLASKTGISGLVLDLRDNPGGLLDQAVQVVDLFIESGLIVTTMGRDKDRVEREFAHKRNTYTGFPVVVLVNGGSASASEIVAGALQDHERALIMGTTTFGKGSVQTILPLPDGSALKLTIARYYTPKDRSIQAKGIAPDIVVPARPGEDAAGKSKSEKTEKIEKPEKTEGPRKESDLERHIESHDLSDIAKAQGLAQWIDQWPEPMRSDYQLTTAFAYLHGYAKLNRREEPGKSPDGN